MSTRKDDLKLKLALQAAFELRACPGSEVLLDTEKDLHLNKHLEICHLCREKKSMPREERGAWQALTATLATPPRQERRTPAPGEVWSVSNALSGWNEDGYFYQAPMVLLLEEIEATGGFKAAQIYFDRRLMGDGDVWLKEGIGFAQGWNSYTVLGSALDLYRETVSHALLCEVREAAQRKLAPVAEDGILYFFRRLECNLGAHIAIPMVAQMVHQMAEDVVVTVTDPLPGVNLMLVRCGDRLKERVLSVIRDGLDALSESLVPPLSLAERSGAMVTDRGGVGRELQEEAGFEFLPTGIYALDGSVHIMIRLLIHKDQPPQVAVTFRGGTIDDSRICWLAWGSETPEIVVAGVTFTLAEEKQANPLVTMRLAAGDMVLEIMPQ